MHPCFCLQILIKNFQNEVTKKCAPPHASTDCMFPVGTGMLLLRSEERISLYDVQQRKVRSLLSLLCFSLPPCAGGWRLASGMLRRAHQRERKMVERGVASSLAVSWPLHNTAITNIA